MHALTLDEVAEPMFEAVCRLRRESQRVLEDAQERERRERASFGPLDAEPVEEADPDEPASAAGPAFDEASVADLDAPASDRGVGSDPSPARPTATAAADVLPPEERDPGFGTFERARAFVLDRLQRADAICAAHPEAMPDWKRMRIALVGLVDEVVTGSALPFADEWRARRWARGIGCPDIGDRFFANLEQDLQAYDPGALPRLRIYLVCLILGFQGSRKGDAAAIADLQRRIRERIRAAAPDGRDRLTPRAADTLPSEGADVVLVRSLAFVAAGLLVAASIATVVAYRTTTDDFADALRSKRESMSSPNGSVDQ